jgi:hypothetical protein
VSDWRDHWRTVCAPKLLEEKKKRGRELPEHEIASYVEAKTGRPSGRGLIWSWLHGEREPFIGQFLALCEKLELDPAHVLRVESEQIRREPLYRSKTAARSAKVTRRRTA